MYFLSESRRNHLIRSLTGLGMPHEMARRLASYSDYLLSLDNVLAANVGRMAERATQLVEAQQLGNKQRIVTLEAYLSADMLLFRTYWGEINDRQLPSYLFPRSARAISGGLCKTRMVKHDMLARMQVQGGVH